MTTVLADETQTGPAPRHLAEQERLAVLADYDILDTTEEEIFDRITRLAVRLFDVRMSMITFIDGHRQWFKSRQGVDYCEGPRDTSFCNVAVRNRSPVVVQNAETDARFRDNPLVTGEPHIRFYAGIPLYAHNGCALGTLCVIDTTPKAMTAEKIDLLRDLAGMANAALELRRLASVDTLTGAKTRRAFCDDFNRALALGQRHAHDVSLVMLDIDHFKRVNDTYGHHAGDAVLLDVIQVCRSELRDGDFIGRLGGEEFAIALPHSDAAAAQRVADKLRAAIEGSNIVVDGAPIRVTASFGVVTTQTAIEDVGTLLELADKALYAAKRSGRNRCVAAQIRPPMSVDQPRRVLKAGVIVFNRANLTAECTVRKLSSTSSELHVSTNVLIPESFKLRIDADGFSKMCRVVSRDGSNISVEFG